MDALDVDIQTVEQITIAKNYCKTHDVAVQTEHGSGPLPDDRPGLLTYFVYFTVSPGPIFFLSARVIQISAIYTLPGLQIDLGEVSERI